MLSAWDFLHISRSNGKYGISRFAGLPDFLRSNKGRDALFWDSDCRQNIISPVTLGAFARILDRTHFPEERADEPVVQVFPCAHLSRSTFRHENEETSPCSRWQKLVWLTSAVCHSLLGVIRGRG